MHLKRPSTVKRLLPSSTLPTHALLCGTWWVLLLFVTTSPLAAAQEPDTLQPPTPPPPGSSLSVYLLTVEPGDAIWELFGHNALWFATPTPDTKRPSTTASST